eukprot:gene3024-3305_t
MVCSYVESKISTVQHIFVQWDATAASLQGVGKSCLVLRYVRGTFDPNSKITERYLSLAPLYYRGAHAAAVVYDITSTESFEKAKYWIGELQKNASGTIVMVLVGNKTDLTEQRLVPEEEARGFADRLASAKTAGGVADIFEAVAAKLAGGLPVSVSARRLA